MTALTDILFRGRFDGAPALDLRAEGDTGDGSTMFGHFTVFDRWYEIDSWIEGHFLERTVKGSARKTIKENRDQIVTAYDHGYDIYIGDSQLGHIDMLREDDEGVFYEVPLYDTDYNRDRILPLLQGRTMDGRNRGSALGASFKFRKVRDEWNMSPKRSDYNPDGIPERTVREFQLFEFGPVNFPASAAATSGVRGLTDWAHDRHRAQAERSGRPTPSWLPADRQVTGNENPAAPPEGHSEDTPIIQGRSAAHLRAVVAQLRKVA
jgi:phage head maturation protease